jgi:predicted ABC-type ATPase
MPPYSDEVQEEREPSVQPEDEELVEVLRAAIEANNTDVIDAIIGTRHLGGPGSGHFGHTGRPGQVGGSAPAGTAGAVQIAKPSSAYPPSRSDGHDTREMFSDGRGHYTEERQQLHEAIIQKFMQGKQPSAAPVAMVFGGGPASGKSTAFNPEEIAPGHVMVNPDEIRALLPEFRERAATDKSAANFAHEEASDISKLLTTRALAGKYNVVLDGTGDSAIEKLGGKIAAMRAAGHTVVGAYVSIPTDIAIGRMNTRAESMKARGEVPRYVPETYLRDVHTAVSVTFPEAIRQGLFDRFELYDNTTVKKLVVSGVKKQMTIHDADLWNAFLAKGRR